MTGDEMLLLDSTSSSPNIPSSTNTSKKSRRKKNRSPSSGSPLLASNSSTASASSPSPNRLSTSSSKTGSNKTTEYQKLSRSDKNISNNTNNTKNFNPTPNSVKEQFRSSTPRRDTFFSTSSSQKTLHSNPSLLYSSPSANTSHRTHPSSSSSSHFHASNSYEDYVPSKRSQTRPSSVSSSSRHPALPLSSSHEHFSPPSSSKFQSYSATYSSPRPMQQHPSFHSQGRNSSPPYAGHPRSPSVTSSTSSHASHLQTRSEYPTHKRPYSSYPHRQHYHLDHPNFPSRESSNQMHPLQMQYKQFRPTRVPPSFTSFSNTSCLPTGYPNSNVKPFNVNATNFMPTSQPKKKASSPSSSKHRSSSRSRSSGPVHTETPHWIAPPTSTTFIPEHVHAIVSTDYRSVAHMSFEQFQHSLPPPPPTTDTSLSVLPDPSASAMDGLATRFHSEVRVTDTEGVSARAASMYPPRSAPHASKTLYVSKKWSAAPASTGAGSAGPTLSTTPVPKKRATGKPVYPPHLSKRAMEEGLLHGKYMYGLLRVRKSFCMEAYVTPIVPAVPLLTTIQAAETYYQTRQRVTVASDVSGVTMDAEEGALNNNSSSSSSSSNNNDIDGDNNDNDKEKKAPSSSFVEANNKGPSLDACLLPHINNDEDEKEKDILVFGHLHRNRAMEGDFVVIELVDADTVMKEKDAFFKNRPALPMPLATLPADEHSVVDTNDLVSPSEAEEPDLTLPLPAILETNVVLEADEIEEEEAELEVEAHLQVAVQLEKMDIATDIPPGHERALSGPSHTCLDAAQVANARVPATVPCALRTYGKVVGIWQHQFYPSFPGIVLAPSATGSSSPPTSPTSPTSSSYSQWYTFKPLNRKLPLSVVRVDSLPSFFTQKHDPFAYLYVARFLPWLDHHRRATVDLVACIGPMGDPFAEIEAILSNHGVKRPSAAAWAGLLDTFKDGWQIPDEEKEKRVDRCMDCVFSIDPETARDLDDAVHVRVLDETVVEVGVHIADVSYFVKPFSKLDKYASQFCNSIYLLNEVIPMLPRRLCEELCSLSPGEERLCFSVIWQITKDGTILDTRFERSIIRSRIKLTYEQVQTWLDGGEITLDLSPSEVEEIRSSLFQLYEISKVLRQQRVEAGLLTLGSKKLVFELDPHTLLPISCERRSILNSNQLNEEFMILANRSVAEKLYASFPDLAFLRNHAGPSSASLRHCVKHWAQIGVMLGGFTSKDLQTSIYGIEDEVMRQLVLFGTSRYMQKAKYICTHELPVTSVRHFALGLDFYTHFTSPIRRYSDIVVHRLLECALANEDPSTLYTPSQLHAFAYQCNVQKDRARAIEEEQQAVFVGFYLNELMKRDPNQHVHYVAHVWKLFERYMELVILELCLEVKVFFADLPLASWSVELENGLVHMVGKPSNETTQVTESDTEVGSVVAASTKKTLRLLDKVPVNLRVHWDTTPPIIKVDLLS